MSICKSIMNGVGKFAFGATALTLLSSLSSRATIIGGCALGAIGTGAYLTYTGIKDLAKGEYRKGATETLVGAGMVACGGFLAASAFNASPDESLFADAAPIDEQHNGQLVSPFEEPAYSQSTCPPPFMSLAVGAAAFAVARNAGNIGFNPNGQNFTPPQAVQREIFQARGKSFARKAQKALANGGKLVRKISFSGVYLIQDKHGNTVGVFKPDDERNYGPNNQGYPGQRGPDPTQEDIAQKQMNSIFQGNPTKRQNLAKMLDHDLIGSLPDGIPVEIESDCFVDQEAEKAGTPARVQKKSGYLQKWKPDAIESLVAAHPRTKRHLAEHPDQHLPFELFHSFQDHPLLNRIPLNEYQMIGIKNILLYNQDGHAGNYLHSRDENGTDHLTPIDMDGILPWRLNGLSGFTSHARANEPFTEEALEYIEDLDPDDIRDVTEEMGLSEQAPINAKALAIVLREFSRAGLTLADIHNFVSNADVAGTSRISEIMDHANYLAVESMEDRAQYQYFEHVKREFWLNGGVNLPPNSRQHLELYQGEDELRLKKAVEKGFWKHFNKLLKKEIRKIRRIEQAPPQEKVIISAELEGGLGNQLFQIATANAYALDLGGEAVFPKAKIEHVKSSPVLDNVKRFDGPAPKLPKYAEKYGLQKLKDNPKSVTLTGLYHSFDYFNHRRTETVKLFSPSPATKQHLETKYSELLKKNTVSVHIRRGDYLKFRQHGELVFNNISEDGYYEKALREFDLENQEFLIFSDDIEFAKGMPALKKCKHITFIEGNKPHEDFYLMSMCKNHIIANSTFSAWAAYLGDNIYKRVICPIKWFTRQFVDRVIPQARGSQAHGSIPMRDWTQV